MAGGRPSSYTQELADKICEELALGKSLRTVCAGEDMPSMQTVFSWFRTKPEFLEQYARAKQESSDYMAEELIDISDTENMEDVQRARLRIDTRKWLMAKMKPKRYGDQIDVTSAGDKIVFMPTELLTKNGINSTSSTSEDSA